MQPTETIPESALPVMSIEVMRTILRTSSFTTPGHEATVEGLEICAKELPLSKVDYGRAFVLRNKLVEKRTSVEHLIKRGAAEQAELDVMDTVIELLHDRTTKTRVMNPQITTLQMVKNTLEQ